MSIFIILGSLFIVGVTGLSIYYVLRSAYKRGEQDAKEEIDKSIIETQKNYVEIASRPKSNADSILDRMHNESKDK